MSQSDRWLPNYEMLITSLQPQYYSFYLSTSFINEMTGSLLHHLFNLPGRKNLTDDACRARLLLKFPCIHYSLPPPPPPPPHDTASSTLSPTVIILIAVLSCCFLLLGYYAIILKLCSRWRRSRAAAAGAEDDAVTDHDLVTAESDRDSVSGVNFVWYIHTVGLDQSVITSITVCKYKKEEGLVDGTDCSVCLAEFREDEDLRLLPKCGHAFHVPCIDTWLASHVNCPLCRAAVVVPTTNRPAAPSEVLQVAVDMEIPQYDANSASTAVQISSPESTEDLEAGHVTSRVPSWTSDLAGNNNIERVQESSTSVSGEDAQALYLQRSVSVELSVLSDSIRRQHEELRDQDEKLDRCSCSGRWMKVMSSGGKRGRGRRIAMKRCCSNGGSLFLARHSKNRIYSSSLLPI